MATRFRKMKTRKMRKSRALKTRKQRGGEGFLERLGLVKKKPITSNGPNSTSLNRIPTSGRTASMEAFIENRKRSQKIKEKTKALRNYIIKLKEKNTNTAQKIVESMPSNEKERIQRLLNYPTLNSLTDEQFLELFKTGKVRSLSV